MYTCIRVVHVMCIIIPCPKRWSHYNNYTKGGACVSQIREATLIRVPWCIKPVHASQKERSYKGVHVNASI